MVATKLAAGWQYHRRGFVDMKLVGRMSIGSVPGALLGVACLALLRLYRGGSVNHILRIMIGVLLITTPAIALLKSYLERTGKKSLRERLPAYITAQNGAVVVGLVGGCLVGMTSIGSGSIIMTLLLLFYSKPTTVLVGTDIVHSVILGMVAGAGHLAIGTVDVHLLAALLLGSIPGAWISAKLTPSINGVWLRRILFSFLFAAGVSMF